MMDTGSIPGYAYGSPEVGASPLTLDDLDRLKQTVLFSDEDARYLAMAGEVLGDQVEAILDVWYGFVGGHPHLIRYFVGPDGQPIPSYLSAVRQRFGKWILDTCQRPMDATWLNYQEEIAQRHYRTKKNRTDGVQSAPVISLRYLIAFIFPITATVKPFLAAKGHSAEDVERMHQAWTKSVTLQVSLWCRPYVNPEDY